MSLLFPPSPQSHRRYKNERASETFRGWDAGVLEQLPLFLQESFPFLLTKRSAIDLAIVREMRDDLVHSKGFKATAEALRQSHLQAYYQSRMKYLNQVLLNDFYKTADGREAPAKDALEFGAFDDPNGYTTASPLPRTTCAPYGTRVSRSGTLRDWISSCPGRRERYVSPRGGGGLHALQ